jgi:hypothetical protein
VLTDPRPHGPAPRQSVHPRRGVIEPHGLRPRVHDRLHERPLRLAFLGSGFPGQRQPGPAPPQAQPAQAMAPRIGTSPKGAALLESPHEQRDGPAGGQQARRPTRRSGSQPPRARPRATVRVILRGRPLRSSASSPSGPQRAHRSSHDRTVTRCLSRRGAIGGPVQGFSASQRLCPRRLTRPTSCRRIRLSSGRSAAVRGRTSSLVPLPPCAISSLEMLRHRGKKCRALFETYLDPMICPACKS